MYGVWHTMYDVRHVINDVWCMVYYVNIWRTAYDIQHMAYDVQRPSYDIHTMYMWTASNIHAYGLKKEIPMVDACQAWCISFFKKIRSSLSDPVRRAGGNVVAFFLQKGSLDWITYLWKLNCMLCKIWYNCIPIKLSSQRMIHNFRFYTMVTFTTYYSTSSSKLH
jgi:hypothetical protein